ncbi:aromatic acid exporter family protein [Senegalia massiliensis]|uniref:Aromatic acid exporter family protein n=1 Tax=Senegalia massiliensis TaxID=1720316 RepID=A0A845QV30_9CLOT|nr:aromatic acid exporter family protein [Senegalia massiliensis]NBI05366.1 aromatic acid exporter family protein [Senegalia massiliensis]
MKNLLYKAAKIAIGVILSIFIANIIGLKYAATAGVICMLSILDTRTQTYIVGIKRLMTSLIAIVLATILFRVGGHNLLVLGVFLMIFIPILTILKSTEGMAVSTVLVTHIYDINTLSWDIMTNEIGILLIGILVAWAMNIHMPNREKEIRNKQFEVESLIRTVLYNMKLELLNQCSIELQDDSLKSLDETLAEGMDYAINFNNDFLLKDNSYFIKYFNMRRQQYQILVNMQKNIKEEFITVEKAKPLSDFTERLSKELDECNTGEDLLKRADKLKDYYENSQLPITRKEFENRAILYQYFNDLIYFTEVKLNFMRKYGEIKYCNSRE